jgi:hypothetical protein
LRISRAALEGAALQLLSDRIRQGDDLPNASGHGRDPLRRQGETVAKSLAQLRRAFVGEVRGVCLEHLADALVEQGAEPLERPVLGLGARRDELTRGALGARARLADGSRCRRHWVKSVPAPVGGHSRAPAPARADARFPMSGMEKSHPSRQAG